MRYLIIANPTAGRGRSLKLAQGIHQRLRRAGMDVELKITAAAGEVRSRTASTVEQSGPGDTTQCIVPCGGDGTIQEAVNALLEHPGRPVVLGLAPGGRCNDFASALGIRPDPDQVADVLMHGQLSHVDVGRINDRYFCTIAAMGFDAAVSRYVNDATLPLSGTPAYIYGAVRVLMKYRPAHFRLSFDDSTFEGSLFLAAGANTPSYGGQMRVAPQASLQDGLLDVCMISPISRLRGLQLLYRVLRAGHGDLPAVRFVRSRSVQVEADPPQEIWADGEWVARTPAAIQVMSGALPVLVPRRIPI